MIRALRQYVVNAFRSCDKLLLLLCGVTTLFGLLVIASATNYWNTLRYVQMQLFAAIAGVCLYVFISSLNIDGASEHRWMLVVVMYAFLLLLIPFGTDNGSGNKSWLDIPGLPFNIQPAEVCKIFFILIIASVMASRQNKPSSPLSVGRSFFHMGAIVILNVLLSDDVGVSMIFVVVYFVMAWTGGVGLIWFALLAGGAVVAAPVLWGFLDPYQQNRILILFDSSIDPLGQNERYHTMRSLRSLTGGGLMGQGLFQGNRTQTYGSLPAQHTDYIFSAIGEELGYFGCAFALLLLLLIVLRVIWVGTRSPDYMRRLVCFGAAAAMIFQIVINVGMCIGVMPVIGLTLPFISYGGTSILSMYAMLGLVSGVYARPSPTSYERYIRPPYMAKSLI